MTGPWLAYNNQMPDWEPVYDRPAIYRRYLFSLERLRAVQLGKDRPQPIPWFADMTTKVLIGPYPPYK